MVGSNYSQTNFLFDQSNSSYLDAETLALHLSIGLTIIER